MQIQELRITELTNTHCFALYHDIYLLELYFQELVQNYLNWLLFWNKKNVVFFSYFTIAYSYGSGDLESKSIICDLKASWSLSYST